MHRALLLLAAITLPAVAAAQSHPLLGAWNVTVPSGMRIENGQPTTIMSNGTMTVTSVGDSLIAMLDVEPPEGMPKRPPRRLAGLRAAGAVTLTYLAEAKMMSSNGETLTRTAISRFTLTAAGDALTGTITREVEGVPGMGMAGEPVTGTRAKS
jgi:hypothetical protein